MQLLPALLLQEQLLQEQLLQEQLLPEQHGCRNSTDAGTAAGAGGVTAGQAALTGAEVGGATGLVSGAGSGVASGLSNPNSTPGSVALSGLEGAGIGTAAGAATGAVGGAIGSAVGSAPDLAANFSSPKALISTGLNVGSKIAGDVNQNASDALNNQPQMSSPQPILSSSPTGNNMPVNFGSSFNSTGTSTPGLANPSVPQLGQVNIPPPLQNNAGPLKPISINGKTLGSLLIEGLQAPTADSQSEYSVGDNGGQMASGPGTGLGNIAPAMGSGPSYFSQGSSVNTAPEGDSEDGS